MTREGAIKLVKEVTGMSLDWDDAHYEALQMAIGALEAEPCEDAIILTKEEYGQLLSNEFDNGYAKGYREALEQNSVLDKIREEINSPNRGTCDYFIVDRIEDILDKYKAESEGKR